MYYGKKLLINTVKSRLRTAEKGRIHPVLFSFSNARGCDQNTPLQSIAFWEDGINVFTDKTTVENRQHCKSAALCSATKQKLDADETLQVCWYT